MSYLVGSQPVVGGPHYVREYEGFGIKGADIPTIGDSAGSPALNDGIVADGEYYWRVETPPASGTLDIYPDLSFSHYGAEIGTYDWTYRLFNRGTDLGVFLVTDTFNDPTHNVVGADSSVASSVASASIRQTHLINASTLNTAIAISTVAIRQTHKVAAASLVQASTLSAGGISQASTTFLSGANSLQSQALSTGAIRQTHRVLGAASATTPTLESAGVRQTHLVGAGTLSTIPTISSAGATQSSITFISPESLSTPSALSSGAVRQTHLVQSSNLSVAGGLATGTVRQTHLVGGTTARVTASLSSVAISTGVGATVWPTAPDVREGVTYGPTGADYTGTYAAVGGSVDIPTLVDAVWAHAKATDITEKVTVTNAVVASL